MANVHASLAIITQGTLENVVVISTPPVPLPSISNSELSSTIKAELA